MDDTAPRTGPPAMRLLVGAIGERFQRSCSSRDVIIVPDFLCSKEDFNIYHQLLNELNDCIKETAAMTKSLLHQHFTHNHLIADETNWWIDSCPTMVHIVKKVSHYLNLKVSYTRLNIYRDNSDWKPYHHDAASKPPAKGKGGSYDRTAVDYETRLQNYTVCVSLGAERDVSFQHASTKTSIDIVSRYLKFQTHSHFSSHNIEFRKCRSETRESISA